MWQETEAADEVGQNPAFMIPFIIPPNARMKSKTTAFPLRALDVTLPTTLRNTVELCHFSYL